MTDNFTEDNLVGEGGYSRVFKGVFEGKLVAVKVFKKLTKESQECFLGETSTLAKLRHRNLTKVIGYCCSDSMMALIMEYMVNGSLKNHLQLDTRVSNSSMDLETKLNIAIDVAQGLQYMHQEFDVPVIHCDLKPDNVLLDADFTAHITDFGISKMVQSGREDVSVTSFKGTIGYAPPEYATSPVVSTTGDIFSFGMLLLVLVTEKSPTDAAFQHENSATNLRAWVMEYVMKNKDKEVLEVSMIQAGLLCTQADPVMRPTSKEVLAMLLDLKGTPTVWKPPLEMLAKTP